MHAVEYANNSQTTGSGSSVPYASNTILNSSHPGGINALFTDGSVAFYSPTVSISSISKNCAFATMAS